MSGILSHLHRAQSSQKRTVTQRAFKPTPGRTGARHAPDPERVGGLRRSAQDRAAHIVPEIGAQLVAQDQGQGDGTVADQAIMEGTLREPAALPMLQQAPGGGDHLPAKHTRQGIPRGLHQADQAGAIQPARLQAPKDLRPTELPCVQPQIELGAQDQGTPVQQAMQALLG